jgi:diguanylate cyclase (GGDEF)-like protein
MELSVDELALQQETVAIWDIAATQMVAPVPDLAWVDANVGQWLNSIFGHDEVFVLDGYDRPIYASVGGKRVSLERFAALAPDLRVLISGVRDETAPVTGRHNRRGSSRALASSTVRTTPAATHESHLMLVGNRPAAASAMLIKPATPNFVRPLGAWGLLVSVRYLDQGFLAELSSRQLISAPRFARDHDRRPGEHDIHLESEWGQTIGHLVWKPELPGTRILWKLVPINLLILIALASVMVFLGRRLRHAAGEIAAAEAQAHHLAFHDSLTGLPNRALFQRQLDRLTSGDGASKRFTLLLLDVDEFKLTNDTLGHDAGDALLRSFAERLRLSIRSDDLVARLGGDEFALLLMGMCGAEEIKAFSTSLLELLGEPIEHHGKPIHSQASIGASCSDGAGGGDMLKHADLALYEAKASGRGVFRHYNAAMWSNMRLRGDMLSIAAAALEGDFVKPFYQPKIDLKTGAIVGFEALLRCCLPGAAPKAAGCIAAAFEDSALAVKLSDRMVDGVIRDILEWRSAGLTFGHVAINAALAELRRGDFADRLLGKLRVAGIAPECIQVEVTESVLLGQAIDQVERTFNELAEAGIKLALDDFGTGFASLTHLKRFPIAIMKIDQSFIRDLQIDAEDGAIVDAVVGLGRALNIQVVAEGIETVMQRDFLSALGCAVGQGYLFGAALPAARISELLLEGLQPRLAA